MRKRFVLPLASFVIALAATPIWAQPQSKIPRTKDGHPDLQGTWNTASLTPLERPAELGTKEFYTPEEAAAYEKKRVAALNRDRRDGGNEADLSRSYNELFLDRGTKRARSSRRWRRISRCMAPMVPRIGPCLTGVCSFRSRGRR